MPQRPDSNSRGSSSSSSSSASDGCSCPLHSRARSRLYDLHLYTWQDEDDSAVESPSTAARGHDSTVTGSCSYSAVSSSASAGALLPAPQAPSLEAPLRELTAVMSPPHCALHDFQEKGHGLIQDSWYSSSKYKELQDLHLYKWPTDEDDDLSPVLDVPQVLKALTLPPERRDAASSPTTSRPSHLGRSAPPLNRTYPPTTFPSSKSDLGLEDVGRHTLILSKALALNNFANSLAHDIGNRPTLLGPSPLSQLSSEAKQVPPLQSLCLPNAVFTDEDKDLEEDEEEEGDSPLSPLDPFSPQRFAPTLSLFSELPDELLQDIFKRVEAQARPTLGLVCRRWHRLEVRLRERLKLDYGTYFPCAPWCGPHRGFLDFTLERVLPKMASLKHLEITNIVKPQETALTDDGLVLIGTWCKQLQVLRLSVSSPGLSGRGVSAALLGCGRCLLELELQRCSGGGVGREALKAIAQHCPQLRSLSLKACDLVTDAALLHLKNARCRMSLRLLNLSHCRNVRDRGLLEAANSFPGLTSIDISHCDVTDVAVPFLPACCPDLKVLSARSCSDISNMCMKAFAAGQAQLEELDVRRARWITAAGAIAVLKHCFDLKRLCIDNSIGTEHVRRLARARKVELVLVSSQHRTPQPLSWI